MIQIDMEMPKSCADCPMCHPKGKNEPWNFCCFCSMQDVDISIFDSKRLDNCPLNQGYEIGRQEIVWIPVSERLPEEREWYLAVFKEKDTGYRIIPRVADYIGKGENKWRIIDEEGLHKAYRDILECIAWMPLQPFYDPQERSE